MKPELDRIKNDVETMQQALGLAPAMAREWVPWLKRDLRLDLWWSLPGLILIASSWLPRHPKARYLGLAPDQWSGVLVILAVLGVMMFHIKKTTANDGRPQSLIREYRRFWGVDSQGVRIGAALALEFLLYFYWALHFRISTQAFIPGLFILVGATYLVLTVISRIWLLLGWALPLLAYGLFAVLLPDRHNTLREIPLGMMFIAIGGLSFILQAWQIRQIARHHESH
jgi:hypothetical protein